MFFWILVVSMHKHGQSLLLTDYIYYTFHRLRACLITMKINYQQKNFWYFGSGSGVHMLWQDWREKVKQRNVSISYFLSYTMVSWWGWSLRNGWNSRIYHTNEKGETVGLNMSYYCFLFIHYCLISILVLQLQIRRNGSIYESILRGHLN